MNGPRIKIKFLGYEFSPKEAKTLYTELGKLFGGDKETHVPVDDPDFLPELKPPEDV